MRTLTLRWRIKAMLSRTKKDNKDIPASPNSSRSQATHFLQCISPTHSLSSWLLPSSRPPTQPRPKPTSPVNSYQHLLYPFFLTPFPAALSRLFDSNEKVHGAIHTRDVNAEPAAIAYASFATLLNIHRHDTL